MDKKVVLIGGGIAVAATIAILAGRKVDKGPTPPPVKPGPGPSPNPQPVPRPVVTNLPMLSEPNWGFLDPLSRYVAIMTSMVGCSLLKNKDRLMRLVARGVDGLPLAEQTVQLQTNCGTVSYGAVATNCLTPEDAYKVQPLLAAVSTIGTSVSRMMEIGYSRGAYITYKSGDPLPDVCIVRYYSGNNNDHLESILGPAPDPSKPFSRPHAGGGRPNNEVTGGTNDIASSGGRPIVGYWDLRKLAFPASAPVGADSLQATIDEVRETNPNVAKALEAYQKGQPFETFLNETFAKPDESFHLASMEAEHLPIVV